MEYNRKRHAVYLLTYHMVFVTKYRKPVISHEIGNFMKYHAGYLCERFGGTVVTAETDFDHIHLLVSLPPDVAPATVVTTLKTQLSKEVHANPHFMEHVSQHHYGKVPFWGSSYFVATTGSVSMETVKQYIEGQRTEEHKRKYEKRENQKKGRDPLP